MGGRTDGWMDGWLGGWMGGWVEGGREGVRADLKKAVSLVLKMQSDQETHPESHTKSASLHYRTLFSEDRASPRGLNGESHQLRLTWRQNRTAGLCPSAPSQHREGLRDGGRALL